MRVGFNVTRADFKASFFDFEKVLDKAAAANRRGLARFGGAVRIRARRSIRRRKKSSKPGSPPSDHSRILRENIFFGEEPERAGVVIGPAALKTDDGPGIVSYQKATETLEEGGPIGIREVFVGGRWQRIGTSKATYRPGLRQRLRRVKIKSREYMGPAFRQVLPDAPKFWADSIKR